MVVASGVIPYQYEGIYPFVSPDNHTYGLSGILFEQAMTVIAAEYHRFAGSFDSPTVFNKYINPNQSPIEFTPYPDGRNLDGRIDNNPGAAAYADYIIDLRNAFIFLTFFTNLGGGIADWFTDWLLWAPGPSGTIGNFARNEYSNTGPITSSDFNELGGSGVLTTADIREVSYQPYSRFNESVTAIYDRGSVRLSPIFPNFMTTAGTFLTMNAREQNFTFGNAPYFKKTAADWTAGKMFLDGDIFFSDTDFCVIPGTATRDNLEGVVMHNALALDSLPGRVFPGNGDLTVDPRGRALVAPPNLPVGGYGVGAINNLSSHPGLIIPSGTLSFHPSPSYDGGHAGSGFYVFDKTVWVQDSEKISCSGLRMFNPLTKDFYWLRIADQTNLIDVDGFNHAWSKLDTVGPFDDGSNFVKFAALSNNADITQIKVGVFKYNKVTLDLTSVTEQSNDWTVFGSSVAPPDTFYDASSDGSSVYVTGISHNIARNIFIFDTDGNISDSKYFGSFDPTWISIDSFGGVFIGGNNGGEMHEIFVDSDPGNDVATLIQTYTVDVTAPGWPGSSVDTPFVQPPRQITGVPGFTDGVWFFAGVSSGFTWTWYLVRGILSGSQIIPQEGFRVNLNQSTATGQGRYYRPLDGYYV